MTSRHHCFYALLLFAFFANDVFAQNGEYPGQDVFLKNFQNCKLPSYFTIPHPLDTIKRNHPARIVQNRERILEVSGDAGFNHFSRRGNSDHLLFVSSNSDIAYLNLKLIYRESLPFYISARYNKTLPFQIDDQFELSFGADQRSYREILRDRIIAKLRGKGLDRQAVLSKDYEKVFSDYKARASALKSPKYVQDLIEDRSKVPDFNQPQIPQRPSQAHQPNWNTLLNNEDFKVTGIARKQHYDSILAKHKARLAMEYNSRIREKDSLKKMLTVISDSIQAEKRKLSAELYDLENELSNKATITQLDELAEKQGVRDTSERNTWANLLMRTNIQLGKFLVNQSDLTINNIFLKGVNIRFGDEKFVQLTAGHYDYGFREVFGFRNDTIKNRSKLFAVKIGRTDGRNLSAINIFLGKKKDPGNLSGTLRTVAGFGLERRFEISKNFSFRVEVAKSTARSEDESKPNKIKELLTAYSTETIAVSGNTTGFLPKTSTDFNITYRYFGRQFESFNANQFYNPQNNFSSRINQPFFKRRLFLSTGVRYTDFRTNGISNNLMTKTLFGSANLSVRLKRLPIIAIGYFPGSQIYWLDKQQLYEYYYYILSSTLSHQFKLWDMPMQAVITFNKFNNRYKDSIVTGAQSSYNIFLTAWSGRFSYSLGYSYQQLPINDLRVLEGGLNYTQHNFRIGSSIKHNHQAGFSRLGYSFVGGVKLGNVGTINMLFERAFLAGRLGEAFPVTTGSIQIIKPLNFSIWKTSY